LLSTKQNLYRIESLFFNNNQNGTLCKIVILVIFTLTFLTVGNEYVKWGLKEELSRKNNPRTKVFYFLGLKIKFNFLEIKVSNKRTQETIRKPKNIYTASVCRVNK